MNSRATIGLILLPSLCAMLLGCGNKYGGDQRYALGGKVSYDGEAIDVGTISFIPISPESQRVSGGMIENGVYNITEEMGANGGQYRVEIRWAKKTGKQFRDPDTQMMIEKRDEGLPKRFHKDSKLTADVSSKQTVFDFNLESP